MTDGFAKIIPTLRYLDAPAAVDWLCAAFGFERHLIVAENPGELAHAQLTFRNGMIMLGSERQTGDYDRLMTSPSAAAGVTQAPYIVVEDADAHCARAAAAGAEILLPVADQDYGGRAYTCSDPEGHVWNFGTYDPWAEA